MIYKFQIIEKIPNATIIHHVDKNGGIWGTNQRIIFLLREGERQDVSKFPFHFPRDLFSFSRPSARAMRSDKCNVYVNRLGNILGIRAGTVYAISGSIPRVLFQIQGDCVLHHSICEDMEGNFYFGEYFMNPRRKFVNVWKISFDLRNWKSVLQLNDLRHIHGIYPDPYSRGVFWMTVGDFQGECFILRTANSFESVERFGDGTQIWRAVNLFFDEQYITWLTDSHLEQNHACRLKRETGLIEIGQKINASTWYGCTTVEGLYIAFTTVERGPAIQTNESSILISEDGFYWKKIYGIKKDFWRPMQLFKYGVMACPSGRLSLKELYISGEGLIGLDGSSIKARIIEEDEI